MVMDMVMNAVIEMAHVTHRVLWRCAPSPMQISSARTGVTSYAGCLFQSCDQAVLLWMARQALLFKVQAAMKERATGDLGTCVSFLRCLRHLLLYKTMDTAFIV